MGVTGKGRGLWRKGLCSQRKYRARSYPKKKQGVRTTKELGGCDTALCEKMAFQEVEHEESIKEIRESCSFRILSK